MWFLLLAVLVATAAPGSAFKPVNKGTGFNCKCVDIMFCLELSNNIRQAEWMEVLNYVSHFIASFKNPPNDVRFAVVRFDGSAILEFNLDDECNNQNTCVDEVLTIPQGTSDSTDLYAGLEKIKYDVVHSAGDRDDVECPDLLIVITDGVWNGIDPVPLADVLKNECHVSIVAIGIGSKINSGNLEEIVSDPDFIFLSPEWHSLFNTLDDLKVLACDTIHYDPACQTCCCGEIHGDMKRQYPDWKSKCCGTQRYNPKRATCCQGVLWEGFDERWTRCCYNRAYDPRYSTCCFNQIVPATRSQDQCCGFTAYNQKHQICCNRRVYRKLKHTQCCGSVAYNPKWEICCRYRVQEGCSATYRCCGYRSYNPRREVCVNPYFSYVRPSPIKYCGQDITLYCGKTVWDPLWNTCCAGRVHPGAVDHNTGCCRDQRYDLNNQLCCDGNLYNVDPSWYQCCGYYYYDPWDQTCCQGYYVVDGKGLCCGYYQIFDHRNQICCGGYSVFNGRPSHTKCCYHYYFGYQPYDIKTELCCYGYVQPGGRHYRCCCYYSYNIKTHMCCYGYIYSRSVFRLIQWCDSPYEGGKKGDPAEELPAADSADVPEPSDEPVPLPLIEDDPEDANGLNAENDPDNQPASETAGGVDVGSGEVETAGVVDDGSGA